MLRAVIVQARSGSSRLPNKVTKDLGGKPVLAHVLDRCFAIPGADVVVCAIAEGQGATELVDIARAAGARVFVGSENDVLSRYHSAADTIGASAIVRITSDCPLIDPEICGRVLHLLTDTGVDYASNVTPRSFPKGLDCEAFTFETLERANRNETDKKDREHVTPWMQMSACVRRANLFSGDSALADMRWTLDYAEDLEFIRAVYEKLPRNRIALMSDVLEVLSSHPELLNIVAGLPKRKDLDCNE
jgi:spore coat polysaccharide biosynthesis protein SpsF (cytidylyltransferase family)